MPNIADMDFSQNTPAVNAALIKLQAMHNLGHLSEKQYADFIPQLKNATTQKSAIEQIKDMEDKWFNPFCKEYLTESLRLAKTKPKESFPERWVFHSLHSRLKSFDDLVSVPQRPMRAKEEDFLSVSIRDNENFTVQKAREIIKTSESLPKYYYNRSENNPQGYQVANTCIAISNTKRLDKVALRLLSGNPNILISYLGKHVMQRPGIMEYLRPKELVQCIEKMENIEKGINPKWSDTAKALYIFRNLYKNCQYDHHSSNSMESVLLENKSICQGFALTYQEMMMRQNIPCRICTSEGAGHVFNEIKLNNQWMPVDVSDAADCYGKHHWSEKQVEDYAFAAKDFIHWQPDNHKHHHRSYGGRFIKDASHDEVYHLTPEQYASAVAEIEGKPQRQKENSSRPTPQEVQTKPATTAEVKEELDIVAFDAFFRKLWNDTCKR